MSVVDTSPSVTNHRHLPPTPYGVRSLSPRDLLPFTYVLLHAMLFSPLYSISRTYKYSLHYYLYYLALCIHFPPLPTLRAILVSTPQQCQVSAERPKGPLMVCNSISALEHNTKPLGAWSLCGWFRYPCVTFGWESHCSWTYFLYVSFVFRFPLCICSVSGSGFTITYTAHRLLHVYTCPLVMEALWGTVPLLFPKKTRGAHSGTWCWMGKAVLIWYAIMSDIVGFRTVGK